MSEILTLDIKDTQPPVSKTSEIGRAGEEIAARFLLKNRYRIVMANFKIPIGRNRRGAQITGEIDIIAFDKDILCFVEVKTRSSDEFASPLAAVNLRKQRQIIRTARMYRKIFNLPKIKFRYDVVSIVLSDSSSAETELFKGFFDEAKFRKNSWTE